MASSNKEPKAQAPLVGAVTKDSTIAIKVGSDGVEYHVHKPLLVHHSEYFRKALNGPWKEAKENMVTLVDVEPGICKSERSPAACWRLAQRTNALVSHSFAHWLYTQRLPEHNDEWLNMGIVKPVAKYWKDEWLHACIKAHAFGERFVAPGFSRAANNLFTKTIDGVYYSDNFARSSICYAFEHIPMDRIILQRLVDKYCTYYDVTLAGYQSKAMVDLPFEFLRRTIHRFQELGKMSAKEKGKERCYLEHVSDKEKGMCKALHMWYDGGLEVAVFE